MRSQDVDLVKIRVGANFSHGHILYSWKRVTYAPRERLEWRVELVSKISAGEDVEDY